MKYITISILLFLLSGQVYSQIGMVQGTIERIQAGDVAGIPNNSFTILLIGTSSCNQGGTNYATFSETHVSTGSLEKMFAMALYAYSGSQEVTVFLKDATDCSSAYFMQL